MAKKLKFRPVLVRMTDEEAKRLKEASARVGASVSWMVRRCIHLGLEKAVSNLTFKESNTDGDVKSDNLTGRAG